MQRHVASQFPPNVASHQAQAVKDTQTRANLVQPQERIAAFHLKDDDDEFSLERH
jgi:hypothetical protein